MKSQQVSRRHEARIIPPESLRAWVVGFPQVMPVRDISGGGLCVTSKKPFRAQSVQTMRLASGKMEIIRKVRTAHCRALGPGEWMVGFAFVEGAPAPGPTIEEFLDSLTSSLIQFS